MIFSHRLKKDLDEKKQENHLVRKDSQALQTELNDTKIELDKTRPKLEKLMQIEQELANLREENGSLQTDLLALQDQYDNIVNERDDLEQQTKEVYEALNEEREAKTVLENRLHEDMLRSPERLHWLAESIPHLNNDIRLSSAPSSPLYNDLMHSSPFEGATPSLLSELQHSFIPTVSASEMNLPLAGQNQQLKLREMEFRNNALASEKDELERELVAVSGELEKLKSRHQEIVERNEVDIMSLKDELTAKKEIIGQLKGKLSSLSGEKATLEIELEGVKDEMNRLRDGGKMENDKLIKEIVEEQAKSKELQGRIMELEEKLSQSVSRMEKLENILVNSTNEVTSMKEEVLNLHKAVASLHNENKFATSNTISTLVGGVNALLLPNNEGPPPDDYFLSVQEGKRKLKISKESQTVWEIIEIRDLLRNVRIPLEMCTKRMLESSLESSSQHMLGNSSEKNDKKIMELEGTLSKVRARLANKTEEVNQLRTIMKARQTTVDVTISSLKSKLDGQDRSHETELTQMKNKIKNLRKERDEQTKLCALTSTRCQEYLGEISKLKKKIEELRGETDQLRSENRLVNVYLERAIKQKLDISQQLDRYREEEERTKVIPLTISASRV